MMQDVRFYDTVKHVRANRTQEASIDSAQRASLEIPLIFPVSGKGSVCCR